MGKLLTADDIRSAADRPTKRIAVPEWGGDVIVATMDAPLRAEYERQLREGQGGVNHVRELLVSICCVDERGERLFGEADVAALAGKSASALDRVFDVASRLNKLRKKDLEELEKNFETAPSGSSPTA